MKKALNVFFALCLAAVTFCFSACNLFNGLFGGTGSQDKARIYSVTLVLNGGDTAINLSEYTAGTETQLPVPKREHYTFDGWYESENFSSDKVTKISANDTGDKTFYAKWSPESYSVKYYVDGAQYTSAKNSYKFGEGLTLPVPQKDNSEFDGWYINDKYEGKKVSSISNSEFGDKTFYGRFNKKIDADGDVTVTAYEGYNEGAYVEFNTVSGVSSYTVQYKKSGTASYKSIDTELVRVNGNSVRADIVGLAAGNYDIKIIAGVKSSEIKNVTVTAYDRSGYAHFGASDGVGGYKSDGTPKTDAQIIYVTEATKNTVEAKIGGTNRKGIVNILSNLKDSSNPVIIRIIGRVSSATWEELKYTKSSDNLTPDEIIAQTKALTKSKYGKEITLEKKSYTQDELVALGFKLNTENGAALDGIGKTSKLLYSSSEFDSCWNNCAISSSGKNIPQNVTVEGIGADAEIFQWGMTWKNAKSIEIRNITFTDYTEDACSFEGGTSETDADNFTTQRIWLHDNTFNIGKNYWDVCGEQDKGDGDGSTDFKGVSYVTISYNRYVGTHKTGLMGGDNKHYSANITFHHNYYENCKSRLPLARQANMHMYNNYYSNSTGTDISLRAYAYAFIENCYFENCNNPIDIQGYSTSTDNSYGVAKLFGCIFTDKNGNSLSESQLASAKKFSYNKLSANDLTKKSSMIIFATTRGQEVASNNLITKGSHSMRNFDTNSSVFYYENGASNVENMLSADKVKQHCMQYAGVLKN